MGFNSAQNAAQTPVKVNTPDFGDKLAGKNLAEMRAGGSESEEKDGTSSGTETTATTQVLVGTPRAPIRQIPNYKRHR